MPGSVGSILPGRFFAALQASSRYAASSGRLLRSTPGFLLQAGTIYAKSTHSCFVPAWQYGLLQPAGAKAGIPLKSLIQEVLFNTQQNFARLKQHMNYFELYDIPVSFNPDQAVVRKRYYELSRQYHPDRFTITGSGSTDLAEAMRMSAMNNEAYKTLRNTDATMAYVLKISGLLEDEEKYNLPASFLMEMMDINEAVSDYEDNPTPQGRENAEGLLHQQLVDWDIQATQLTSQFANGNPSSDLLLKIKDQYFRKKYLLRIQERIDRFAAR